MSNKLWNKNPVVSVCAADSFGHVADRFMSSHAFFPLVATEVFNSDALDGSWIQTVRGHSVSVRVGARAVETLDSAGFTESVLRHVCVERVGG